MKIKSLLIALFALVSGLNAQNLQLRSNIPYSPDALANICGYKDAHGNEYAMVGTDFGVSIVDVTDPDNPVIKFVVNGPNSIWREIKIYRTTMYVTTEGGGGLQIVDLSNIPTSIATTYYNGDGAINGQLNSIHALHCDTAKGYLYLYGSNINDGNTLFLDLNTDPLNPTYAGEYVYGGGGTQAYVHDGYVANDTMYESHIYSGFFTVVDVTDKNNPVLLATQQTPTNFTHNTWLSDDHKTLFTTDENSGSYLGAFDISDLANIKELSRFQTAPGSGAIIHNTHILNDYAITSWYVEGVVITDVSRPANPIEVGHYDTYPGTTLDGFNGCWGVYPFLPSGNIIASDIDEGLFVLTPTYVRGCYLEGKVTDSITGASLNNALVEVLTLSIDRTTDFDGDYKTGYYQAGTYDVRVSHAGYYPKVITGVSLSNGVLTNLDVQLLPFQTFAFSGTVLDSLTGQGVPNANVVISSASGLIYRTQADQTGAISFPGVVPDTYTVYAGKWGYRTSCSTKSLVVGDPIVATIAQGYYDDFTFNNGWTVTGTSANSWERAEPVGTYDNGNNEINPDFDVNSDCSDTCFVTDNGGAPYNSTDVDNGTTILTSPAFDGTIYQNPTISYYRRYLCINGTGNPNDTMKIALSNGVTSVELEAVEPFNPSNGTWVQFSAPIPGNLALTANMHLIVTVSDNAPGNIVEGALDQFEVNGTLINSVPVSPITSDFSVYPNPFSESILISCNSVNNSTSSKVIVRDILGKIVFIKDGLGSNGSFQFGAEFPKGVYMVQLINGNEIISRKVVKD